MNQTAIRFVPALSGVSMLALLGLGVGDRDFSENHIPALLAERQVDLGGWGDIERTPAALRALVLTPREALDLAPILAGPSRPDWVIVRGPIGPEAWPMFPTWVYAARDACKAAGVPFTFCGWGDYVPETDAPIQINGFSKRRRAWMDEGAPDPRPVAQGEEGRWWTEKLIQEWGSLRESGEYFKEVTPFTEEVAVYRVGAERAGKMLEGVVLDERPMRAR